MTQTIAVLGASADRSKFGNKCVRAYLDSGWEVVPVNPKEEVIEGLPCLGSITELREPPDRISVYLPPATSLALLPEIADAGAGEVWFNPGAADASVLEEARRLGIPAAEGCSIVDIGRSPSEYN